MGSWNRNRWMWSVSAVVLVGALLITSVVVADDDKGRGKNPFHEILNKLDQILDKLMNGGGAGNHTLRWDTNNPSATRFTTAFTGAVLDHNTGLVWEQAPDAGVRDWPGSTYYCISKTVGPLLVGDDDRRRSGLRAEPELQLWPRDQHQ